jgi:hypothetical protein
MMDELCKDDWEAINGDGTEHAALIYHRPSGWKHEQAYVVVRSLYEDKQKLLLPRYTFILFSRNDLDYKTSPWQAGTGERLKGL